MFRKLIFFSVWGMLILTYSAYASNDSSHIVSIDNSNEYRDEHEILLHVSAKEQMNDEEPTQWSPKLNDPKEDEFSWKLDEIKTLENENSKLLQEMNNILEVGSKILLDNQKNLKNHVEINKVIIEKIKRNIDDLKSLYEENKKSIKQNEDWLLSHAEYGEDDPETFINNIYEERMESQSYEEKSRSILERDQLLKELRERKGEDGED